MTHALAGRLLVGLLAIGLAGCRGCRQGGPASGPDLGAESTVEADRPTAASESGEFDGFASVEALGPHRYESTLVVTDLRDGVQVASHTTVLRLAWRTADQFRMQRAVDGEVVTAVRVRDGAAYRRAADGSWQPEDDPELVRNQLATSWNQWKDATEPFGPRVVLTESGTTEVRGRAARQLDLGLNPPDANTAPAGAFTALSLSGTTTVDAQTSARLAADLEGELQQGSLTRRISFTMERSTMDLQRAIGTTAPDVGSGRSKARTRSRANARKRGQDSPFGGISPGAGPFSTGRTGASRAPPSGEQPTDSPKTEGDEATTPPAIDVPLD